MTIEGRKKILVVGDSGLSGDRIVSQIISQGFHVKVSGNDWSDTPVFLKTDEGRKSGSDVHMGLGGKLTAMHDETTYMPHSASRLYDTTGNYVSADQEDTVGGNILRDDGILASSGGRGNAYKKAVYDPHAQINDLGGEYTHTEWEKDDSSDISKKKPSATSSAPQARFATETGSYVGEFMSMYSPPQTGEESGKGIPGYQTIMESPYNNHEASKDQVNPREFVDMGGAVDHGPSASKDSLESREKMDESRSTGKNVSGHREAGDWSTAYNKLEGSIDAKERLDAAFEGVDGLLCIGYSPTRDMSGSAKMLFDAAKKKGIGHVVYLSMQGASKKTGVGHLDAMFDMEQHLKNSGLSYTILRPSLYMEDILSDKALSSLHEGHLEVPMSPDRLIDLVSATDVGRVVAEVFQIPKKFNGKEIDLSADRLSLNKIASEVGRVFSKKIEFRKTGGPMDFQGSMKAHFQWVEKSDHHADIKQTSELLNRYNIQLTSFRDYLREMKVRVPFEKAA